MAVTELVHHPEEVAQLAGKKELHTLSFYRFLKKNKKSKEIDETVHRLDKEISEKIDCTQCGQCCKVLNAAMEEDEVLTLAVSMAMTKEQFRQEFLEHDELEHAYFIRKLPCHFLSHNQCTIYQQRPASCSEYPHLQKPNFIFRTKSVHANYLMCPIVYNVVEQMKIYYGFL